MPPYFSQAVITADRKTATLAFGIRLMPLDEQQKVIDVMRDRLDPPAGVTARMAGLQVLGAEANSSLSSPLRRLGTLLAGLLAVGLALLLVYRRWERAWVPLVPIALASGWSALVLFVLRVPLNPMSATLGALVIAISTEFSVLLTARYREERAAGLEPRDALRRTYASTGAAVVASGATAIAGFAVLALSDVQMLSDFGRVTVVDLSVSLLGVLAVLPAVLMLAERRARGRRRSAPAAGGGGARGRRMSAPGPPRPPAGTSRYTWIVGVLVVLGLAYITLNTLGTEKPGSRGVPNGSKLPPFAVPIATSKLKGDAQVDPSKACKVRGSDVLNSCQLAERGPVVLAFFATRSKRCEQQVDVIERVRRRFPDVGFAAVVGARRPRRRARPGAQARLGDAGRLRPRRRGHQRLRGGDLPDDHVRAPGRDGGGHVVQAARGGGARARGGGAAVTLASSTPRIAAEFPELRLLELHARRALRPQLAPELRERLRVLSDRFRGAQAIELRRQPIPHAYRVFFRHIGLDPDEHRTPVEALALERLKAGGFASRSVLDDALTIAVMETGVPVWALDADRLEGELGLRAAQRGERLGGGEYAHDLPGRPAGRGRRRRAGRRAVRRARPGPRRRPRRPTRITLLALQVAGVPDIHVEEALWTVRRHPRRGGLTAAARNRRESRDGRPARARPRDDAGDRLPDGRPAGRARGRRARLPALTRASPAEMRERLHGPAPEAGTGFDVLLATLERDVLAYMGRVDHPAYFAFIPGSSTWPGALGDFLASALNIYAGSWMESSGPSQVELQVLDWFKEWIGYPADGVGVLLSGGSAANMTALACARETLAGAMRDDLVVYVSDQAHSSLARAARTLGFRPDQVHGAAGRRPTTACAPTCSRARSPPTSPRAARRCSSRSAPARPTPARSTRCRAGRDRAAARRVAARRRRLRRLRGADRARARLAARDRAGRLGHARPAQVALPAVRVRLPARARGRAAAARVHAHARLPRRRRGGGRGGQLLRPRRPAHALARARSRSGCR